MSTAVDRRRGGKGGGFGPFSVTTAALFSLHVVLWALLAANPVAAQTTEATDATLFQDTSWEKLDFSSSGPGTRYGAATLSIASPKGLILFGGVDENGALLGDTWQYLADQNLWLELKQTSTACCGKNCTTGTPCPRFHSTLHSVSTRALLFGGSCERNPEFAYTGKPCEDILWEFDLLNNKWKRIYAEGYHDAVAPVPRAGHAAVSQGWSLYVYGGHTGSVEVEGDERVVWEYRWDQNEWTKLEPQGEMLKNGNVINAVTFALSKRFGHSAIVHQYQNKKRILFHGGLRTYEGFSGTAGKLYVSNDFLEWDITTSTWRRWDLQYSPFRAFHAMHLYSPSSAFSQGTGYIVMAFGYGHDSPNTRGISEVVSADTEVVRGADIHIFDDNSQTSPNFSTYKVLQGEKPAARHAATSAFVGDGQLLTIGGKSCTHETTGLPEAATCSITQEAYWKLHLKGQLYDQGTLSVPPGTEEGVEEVLVMSGEVEIAKWEKGTALPVQLSIPSGTDIVAIGFKNGTVATTEKLSIVPEETKTLQLVYLQRQKVVVSCRREDLISAFPGLSVVMEVYDVRNQVWNTVATGTTAQDGTFTAELIPVRGLYGGTLAEYVTKYETSYRFMATLSTENGSAVVIPSQLIETYPGSRWRYPTFLSLSQCQSDQASTSLCRRLARTTRVPIPQWSQWSRRQSSQPNSLLSSTLTSQPPSTLLRQGRNSRCRWRANPHPSRCLPRSNQKLGSQPHWRRDGAASARKLLRTWPTPAPSTFLHLPTPPESR